MSDAAAGAAPLVSFERVCKRYVASRPVLNELDLTVARGEFVAFTGAGGSGKTTVLRLVAGLEFADSGRVTVAGSEPARLRAAALAALRRAIGIVPQEPLLLDDRSVLDNVMLPALAAGLSRRQAAERARAALHRVGLDEEAAAPQPLSGSARQRAALARAIVNRPTLLLVDEPTAHLDAAATMELLALLAQFADAGVAVLLASHEEKLPLPGSARRLRLADGRLVA